MIRVKQVSKTLGGTPVLDCVSFVVPDRKVVAVLGPSGTGKTVLLRVLAALVEPDSGEVTFDGGRERLGFVFQTGALFDSLSVEENVALPIEEHFNLRPEVVRRRSVGLLERVGMADARILYPKQLSGGMTRLVAIARALALDPAYLLYDEPTTGLDPLMRDRVCDLIATLREREGKTQVVVTHDLDAVRAIADEILMLRDGRLTALAAAHKEDYENPCS